MTDREALRAAILAHPDEDTPRLVFADYLDENDQPHWAALIRAECAREQLRRDDSAAESLLRFIGHINDQGGCAHIEQRVRWDRAEPEVGRRYELEKAAAKARGRSARVRNAGRPSGAKCGLTWGKETRRGFPAAATVTDGAKFAKHFEAVTRWCPPLKLTISPRTEVAPQLVDRGLLRWVRELELYDTNTGLFVAICASKDATRVRALTIQSYGVGLAATLAGAPNWSGLHALDIPHSALTDEPAAALFSAQHLGGLEWLWLTTNGWTTETVDAFLRGPFRNLRELGLRFGSLDDAAAERLAVSPMLANVQYLDLSHNLITGRGASALLASKHLKNLVILELEGNPIRDLDRAALANAPAGGLRALALHGCQLETEDVEALARCPRLSELLYLDLDFNQLHNAAVIALVAGLPCAPAVVYLMGNQISTKGAQALARWAGAPGLDQLHVCGNPMTSAGAAALAQSPTLAGLRHLCVTGVTGADREALEARFKKRVEFPT